MTARPDLDWIERRINVFGSSVQTVRDLLTYARALEAERDAWRTLLVRLGGTLEWAEDQMRAYEAMRDGKLAQQEANAKDEP